MKREGCNVLAPHSRMGCWGDFLLNFAWSLFWLARSVRRMILLR
mgnify:FL=1